MGKTSFILLTLAFVSAGVLMLIASSVGTDEATGIGILFGILFPLLLIAAAITGLMALVFQKPYRRNRGGGGRRLGATQAGAGGLRDDDALVLAEALGKRRDASAYLAVALPLLALALFAYIAIPQVRKPILEMRAKAGDVDAQYELGFLELVEAGISPPTSPATNRFYWLTKAAHNGRLGAQLDLGRYYLYDERNFEMAERWLKPIAESTNDGWERLNARNDMDSLVRLRGESLEQKSTASTNTNLEISP
jgi:hypothetical protein